MASQEGDKDCYECHNPSSQYQQFPGRYPPDEHHQVDRSEEQHSRRVVFRQDKATDNAGNNHDALKGFRTCTVFILPFREDKGGNDDDGHLRYFRRLELNTHEGHPAAAPFTRSPVMNPISITKASSPMDIGSRNTGNT